MGEELSGHEKWVIGGSMGALLFSSDVATVGRTWAADPWGKRQRKSELDALLLARHSQEGLPLGHFGVFSLLQALCRTIGTEVVWDVCIHLTPGWEGEVR